MLVEGKAVCSNDIEIDPAMKPWRTEVLKRGYHSALSIPIKKSGEVIGSFNLYAETKNFFDLEGIALLEQATSLICLMRWIFLKKRH